MNRISQRDTPGTLAMKQSPTTKIKSKQTPANYPSVDPYAGNFFKVITGDSNLCLEAKNTLP